MQKIVSLFSIIILCSCVQLVQYPYTGTKTVTGQGGFLQTFIPVKDIRYQTFEKKYDYEYDGVAFFVSGLPAGEKCTLKGYIAGSNPAEIAKHALKMNANVATKSTVRFPISFETGGQLDGVGTADDWYNAHGNKVAKGYNIFECK